MKAKTFIIVVIIYLISVIALKNKINIFFPYYLLKDVVFFSVKAIDGDVIESKEYKDGIESELKKEIEELKHLNELSSTLTEFDKVSSIVIERNRMYWFNTITINKGSQNGIKEDMAVVSKDGLVGKITKVSKTTSLVKLITTNDVNNKISVMIKFNNDIIYGIMSGYDYTTNTLKVTSLNKDIDNISDSLVYTSGMGGIFPSGILIGKVKEIKKDKYDVSKIIEVEPNTNFNEIRFVNILIRK